MGELKNHSLVLELQGQGIKLGSTTNQIQMKSLDQIISKDPSSSGEKKKKISEIRIFGVSVVVQWKQIGLVFMRMQV